VKGKVFVPERMEWHDALLKDVKPGQEFIAENCLYKVLTPNRIKACPEVDVSKIPDADRPFDSDNWRTPNSFDVVYVLGEGYPNTGHWLMCDVQPHQQFLFHGRIYFLAPGRAPGICKLMDTGKVARWNNGPLYVWVESTIEDALGRAVVSYRYPKDRRIPLANGRVLPVEQLLPGMQFLLELGGISTVTKVSKPQPWDPEAEFRDGYGNAFRRVIGTFQFDGWVQLMTVTVCGWTHRVTPSHPYWSVTRKGWHPIRSFAAGELVLTAESVPVPIQDLTPPQWVRETVYNVEVEEYHTYFVGRSSLTAVWAHNGAGGGCGVPRALDPDSPEFRQQLVNDYRRYLVSGLHEDYVQHLQRAVNEMPNPRPLLKPRQGAANDPREVINELPMWQPFEPGRTQGAAPAQGRLIVRDAQTGIHYELELVSGKGSIVPTRSLEMIHSDNVGHVDMQAAVVLRRLSQDGMQIADPALYINLKPCGANIGNGCAQHLWIALPESGIQLRTFAPANATAPRQGNYRLDQQQFRFDLNTFVERMTPFWNQRNAVRASNLVIPE
jgi:hypothetical protein